MRMMHYKIESCYEIYYKSIPEIMWIDAFCFGYGEKTYVQNRIIGCNFCGIYTSLNSCCPFKCEICHLRHDEDEEEY